MNRIHLRVKMNHLKAFNMLAKAIKVLSDSPLKIDFTVLTDENGVKVYMDCNCLFELQKQASTSDWHVICQVDFLNSLDSAKSSGDCVIDNL